MREQSFVINRGGYRGEFPFGFRDAVQITTGIEGEKMLAWVESERGKHGKYFFKKLFDEEEGGEQYAKWQYLREHGVKVPNLFKRVVFKDGGHYLLIQDLCKNGRYLVLSANNPEIFSKKYLNASKRISKVIRKGIIRDMVFACEAAGGKYDGNDNPEGIIYEFGANAFVLAISRTDPDDASVYVADFGADVMELNKQTNDPQSVIERNLENAGLFYVWMTGETFRLPRGHPLATAMNPEFVKSGKIILKQRGY